MRSMQIGLSQLPKAGGSTHVEILKKWLAACDKDHRCYPSSKDFFLPTRILDVGNGDADGKTIWLKQNGLDSRKTGRYIALSHRWGPQHSQSCAYKSNVGKLAQGIATAELPQSFQEAVRITRDLGLRYLWIDSFCIIQDDPKDWELESKRMERVYSSAYCTIAATCASGSSDSFLKPRPEWRCVTMRSSSGSGSNARRYYVCEAIDDFAVHVDQSELNQRGWVLQERALSRRTIHFTATQSYWECGGGVRCETLTKMKKCVSHALPLGAASTDQEQTNSQKASFLGDPDFPHSVRDFLRGKKIKLFQDLYQRYSGLVLSYYSDRPIAIKGLEARLVETFGTTGGYGIFGTYLHHSLLWQRSDQQRSDQPWKRIESFRGGPTPPSWSWMKYNGRIRYMTVPLGQVSWKDDIVSPFPKDPAAGQSDLLGGSPRRGDDVLELEAPVRDITGSYERRVVMDDHDPDPEEKLPSKCVIVGIQTAQSEDGTREHYVLLVRAVSPDSDKPVYERVGVAIVEQKHITSTSREGRIR